MIIPIEKRLEIYKSVLSVRVNWPGINGPVCPSLFIQAEDMGFYRKPNGVYKYKEIKEYFPEFYRQKPWFKKTENVWWNGPWKGLERIEALKKAIKLTEKKIRNGKI